MIIGVNPAALTQKNLRLASELDSPDARLIPGNQRMSFL